MSVVLPGWGHFYLGRRWIAACEFACAFILLAAATMRLIGAFLEVVDDRARIFHIIEVVIPWLLILAAYSVADGLFTLAISRRCIIRDDSAARPRP